MNLSTAPLVGRLPGRSVPTLPLVLEIDLSRGLADQAPSDPLSALRQRNTPTLATVLRGLHAAARADEVAAVLVLLGGPVTAAQADELAMALRTVAGSGKRTVAFAEAYGELGSGTIPYALASACESVWIQPSGSVGLTGLSLAMTLLRGGLDKLGVQPQFGQRHEYKTAANQFSAEEITDAHREMTQRIADSLMEHLSAAIAQRRGLAADLVADAVAQSPLSAARALELGLVDRLGYRDEVYSWLREEVGRNGEIELLFASRFAARVDGSKVTQVKRRKDPVVGVVEVRGQIVSGRSRPGGLMGRSAGSDTVVAALGAAARSDDVKAVVLHVDSPGGSYVASDAIRRAVQQLRASGRPVVASMGSVAASGGYFVAMPAERVIALPTTLTGSIGVLAGKMVLRRTWERLGVVRAEVSTGPRSTMFSTLEPFSMDQWVALDLWLDEVYADFTRKAAVDRAMAYERLEPLARGRVWTGADAERHGLVDELGGRRRALELACELAGLDTERVKVQPVPHVPWMERLKPAESTASAAALAADLRAGGNLDGARKLLGSATGPEALLGGLADLLDGIADVGVLSAPLLPRVR
jgi:protease-4